MREGGGTLYSVALRATSCCARVTLTVGVTAMTALRVTTRVRTVVRAETRGVLRLDSEFYEWCCCYCNCYYYCYLVLLLFSVSVIVIVI